MDVRLSSSGLKWKQIIIIDARDYMPLEKVMNGGESGRIHTPYFYQCIKKSGYKSNIGGGRLDLLYNHTCKHDS